MGGRIRFFFVNASLNYYRMYLCRFVSSSSFRQVSLKPFFTAGTLQVLFICLGIPLLTMGTIFDRCVNQGLKDR